ncbi:MAG: hypothetical protein IKM06_04580, partial [Clostridia bacterium]|nr:hypothetical protein [Clostridia bacterium]
GNESEILIIEKSKNMKYIVEFCQKFDYPDEATEALKTAYKKITQDPNADKIFNHYVEKYNNDEAFDHYKALDEIEKASLNTGIHPYTVKFLFYLRLSIKLKSIYEERKLSEEIYHNTMLDLKWKLIETHNLYGIWGAFVAHWFRELFTLERFALGRLQFDIVELGEDFMQYSKDTKAVNVHIPPMGRLERDDCINAYKQAFEFFKEYKNDGKMLFCCHSWLLHPALEEILPEKSNILKFKRDYHILRVDNRDPFREAWRIFYRDCDTCKIEDYPETTSLQKSIKKWLLDGNKLGAALGAFEFDGENIL